MGDDACFSKGKICIILVMFCYLFGLSSFLGCEISSISLIKLSQVDGFDFFAFSFIHDSFYLSVCSYELLRSLLVKGHVT